MKSKKILPIILLVLCLTYGLLGVANAADTQVVLNFNEVTDFVDPIPTGYAGLNWESGWYAYNIPYQANYKPHSAPTYISFVYDSKSKAWIDFSPLGTDVIFEGAWFGGHSETGTIWFEGWRDGELVATSGSITVQQYSSIYLPANFGERVDMVYVCVGSQTRMDEFSMDDLTYTIPEPINVNVDIMPNDTNTVNLKSKGVLPVAILGSADFDVAEIYAASVKIGDICISKKGNKLQFAYEDVNFDGYIDAVFKFSITALVSEGELVSSTTSLTITGQLLNDGGEFEGTDNIIIVPNK